MYVGVCVRITKGDFQGDDTHLPLVALIYDKFSKRTSIVIGLKNEQKTEKVLCCVPIIYFNVFNDTHERVQLNYYITINFFCLDCIGLSVGCC